MSTEQLVSFCFAGIADHVEITEGEGGLPKVVLKHACGSKAEVSMPLFFPAAVVCCEQQEVSSTKLSLSISQTRGCACEHERIIVLQIYLFGGVVTSWTQPSGDEVLFVRPDAKFDKSKPISGGIPHCFPQVDTLQSSLSPLLAMRR